MASFETQRRDESARHFVVAERRAPAAQAAARQSAHRRNVAAVRCDSGEGGDGGGGTAVPGRWTGGGDGDGKPAPR
jgi:hypothetical protein